MNYTRKQCECFASDERTRCDDQGSLHSVYVGHVHFYICHKHIELHQHQCNSKCSVSSEHTAPAKGQSALDYFEELEATKENKE